MLKCVHHDQGELRLGVAGSLPTWELCSLGRCLSSSSCSLDEQHSGSRFPRRPLWRGGGEVLENMEMLPSPGELTADRLECVQTCTHVLGV